MARRTAKRSRRLDISRLDKRVQQLRARAEKLARRTWDDTLDLLPAGQRKAIRKATARLEKARRDIQRRSERAIKDINARGRKIVAEVEKRAADAAKPIIGRLDVATRADVERLSRRVAMVERKLRNEGRRLAA